MKKRLILAGLVVVIASGLAAVGMIADDHDRGGFEFAPDSLVVTRSVYEGTASTVTVGEVLPPGCVAGNVLLPNTTPPGGTTSVSISTKSGGCIKGGAIDDGEFPNLTDAQNVWNNDTADGSFSVTSPIFLDDISTNGSLLNTLPIDPSQIVTSFSSKSELALNRSEDGKSLTFMGYRGGPGCPPITFVSGTGTPGTVSGPISPTRANLLDVSNSNTPGVCDPSNPAVGSVTGNPTVPTAYYRSVAEVDSHGHLQVTDGNAYSGDNGRAAIKGSNWLYYMAGNDNNGGAVPKSGANTTVAGVDLVASTGVELLVPGQTPPTPPNINKVGDFEVTSLGLPADKAGKDDNFRGLTIHNHTLYATKGSGGNGINTVYQVGTSGVLPTGSTAAELAATPITILPGFPSTEASTSTVYPFGIWFADDKTLYVCDEGDGTYVAGQTINGVTNVADTASIATAGVQKWVLSNGTWSMAYVLQNGLNIGIPYGVANYPASINPATGGCRNITGRNNHDGTATIYAVTSTISLNGDQGADPNKLVKVIDLLGATTLPTGDGDHDRDDQFGIFTTIRTARAGEVLRGVAFAPSDDGDDDRGGFFGFGGGFGGFFNWF